MSTSLHTVPGEIQMLQTEYLSGLDRAWLTSVKIKSRSARKMPHNMPFVLREVCILQSKHPSFLLVRRSVSVRFFLNSITSHLSSAVGEILIRDQVFISTKSRSFFFVKEK